MKKSGKESAYKPPFASGRKQSLGWMPDGETDPIAYLCRCLDHGARDAVEEAKPDPVTPLAELTAKRHFAGKRLKWLFGALCNQLDFESSNCPLGERNTDELLCAFFSFMQWRVVPYLEARHGDDVRMGDALQSVCNSAKVETVRSAPMLDGSDGEEVHQLALAVTPDEFRQRLTDLLDLDAATQQTAQAVDDGEIARKVDALGGRLKDIEATATAAALNTATINDGVAWLIADRQKKIKGNKKRGKNNQATGNTEESERAAQDMQTALNRVHDRMKHGAKNVIGECRKVCKEFEPLTTKKNELGKFELYAPLTGVDGRPIKPDTLAKNYRERFGTKKAKKASTARTAKPKRRIK